MSCRDYEKTLHSVSLSSRVSSKGILNERKIFEMLEYVHSCNTATMKLHKKRKIIHLTLKSISEGDSSPSLYASMEYLEKLGLKYVGNK